jgi:hypothetical protein
MVKVGELNDYRKAQQMLRDAGYILVTNEGEIVKKTFVNGIEAVSIGKWKNGTWIFRYNNNYFSEAK